MDGSYRMCTKTVMDTTDPDITFDENGVSNHWHNYQKRKAMQPSPQKAEEEVDRIFSIIKESAKNSRYDCVIGLSGGTDSSYLAHLVTKKGLRPLIVHFDNGFNTEQAVNNIEQIVKRLNLDLHTYVMDWEEFKDLQRSYYLASVLDLEVPNDHMIFGALYKIAAQYNVKYIFDGFNFATESILPNHWRFEGKFDLVNLKNIHKKFGKLKTLKRLPSIGVFDHTYYNVVKGIKQYAPLAYLDYNKNEIKKFLISDLGWKDYGGKHFESVHTRFYQGYILPRKYNIDKRKAHMSSLICSGQMTREQALEELAKPTYDPMLQEQDKKYIAKKLGFSDGEFEAIINLPPVPHEFYGTDKAMRKFVFNVNKTVKKIFSKSFSKI
jgi:N-acetyl sugar amidotransferase